MMILDVELDDEKPISTAKPYHEEIVEEFSLNAPHDGLYIISIAIPFTVHAMVDGKYNAACRVYLDGDDWLYIGQARQWNGRLLTNGGQWCFTPRLPMDGHSVRTLCVPMTIGDHKIRVCVSASSNSAILTLRSRRLFQVWE